MAEGVRFNTNKPRVELLPPYALLEIARGFTAGAIKYTAYNWMLGGPDLTYMKMLGSLLRHMAYWVMGEEIDQESKKYIDGGVSHLALMGCNIMMLIEMTRLHPGLDDRPCKLSDATMAMPERAPAIEVKPAHGASHFMVPTWSADNAE